MKKFDKMFNLIMKESKKRIIKEDVDNNIAHEIEDALKLIKIDVTPAIDKLKELGYIDGEKSELLQDYVNEEFSYIDIDDVLMSYKLALIREELGLNIEDTGMAEDF